MPTETSARRTGRRLGMAAGALAFAAALVACSSSSSQTTSAAAGKNCVPAHKFSTVQSGYLSVVGAQYAPWYTVTNGQPAGVEVDILKAVAAKECLQVTGQALDGPGVVSAVTTGRADLAAGGWVATKARQKVLGITVPIYADPIAILSKTGIDSFATVKKDNIALGDLGGDLEVAPLQALLGNQLKVYQTYAQAVSDMKDGRLGAVTMSLSGAVEAIKQYHLTGYQAVKAVADPAVPPTVSVGQIGWLTNLKNVALREALDADLNELRANGTLNKIFEQNGEPVALLNTGPAHFI